MVREEFDRRVGRNLRKRRKALRLSQEEVADYILVTFGKSGGGRLNAEDVIDRFLRFRGGTPEQRGVRDFMGSRFAVTGGRLYRRSVPPEGRACPRNGILSAKASAGRGRQAVGAPLRALLAGRQSDATPARSPHAVQSYGNKAGTAHTPRGARRDLI